MSLFFRLNHPERKKSEVTQSSPTLWDPVDPLSMGFSRQEYWSGLPFPSTGDLPEPGIKPRSPALQADALPSEPPEKGTIILSLVQTSYLEFLCVCVVFFLPTFKLSSEKRYNSIN